MQRVDMGTAVRQYLGNLGVGEVTGTLVVRALDRSARRINNITKLNKVDITVALQTGVREYTMPTATMDVYRVRIGTGSSRKRLKPTTVAALDRDEGDWEAGTAGTPTRYYTDGMKMGFVPKPHGTAAAGTIYVNCLQNPSPLSTASSQPSWCPAHGHDTIAKGAAIDIAGGFLAGDDGSQVRLTTLYQEYLQEVADIRRMSLGRSREYQPQVRVKGYDGFRRP